MILYAAAGQNDCRLCLLNGPGACCAAAENYPAGEHSLTSMLVPRQWRGFGRLVRSGFAGVSVFAPLKAQAREEQVDLAHPSV